MVDNINVTKLFSIWFNRWFGEPTCSKKEIKEICAALDRIYEKIDECPLTGLDDLKNCIKQAHNNVWWKCISLIEGVPAQHRLDTITLTPIVFEKEQRARDAILLHEIIHDCGGTELDSEGFENHYYRLKGRPPSPDDFPKFRKDGGKWLNWNGSTGIVTTKDGQRLNTNRREFKDPNPP